MAQRIWPTFGREQIAWRFQDVLIHSGNVRSMRVQMRPKYMPSARNVARLTPMGGNDSHNRICAATKRAA